jgi:hypothetical protein
VIGMNTNIRVNDTAHLLAADSRLTLRETLSAMCSA